MVTHKRNILLAFFGVMLCCCAILLASCELFIEEPPQGTIRVLSIGISYFNMNINKKGYLYGPITDATAIDYAFENVAKKTGKPVEHISLIQKVSSKYTENNYPSKKNILANLDSFKNKAQENDLTIVYFSGHGYNSSDPSQGPCCLVVPPDNNTGEIFAVDSDNLLPECSLSVAELRKTLLDIQGKKLLILDCCFSGGHIPSNSTYVDTESTGVQSWQEGIQKLFAPPEETMPADLFVMAAARADLSSYEPNGKGIGKHGFFTQEIIEGMGIIEDEAYDWISASSDISAHWQLNPEKLKLGISPAKSNSALTLDGLYAYVKNNMSFSQWRMQYPQVIRGPYDLVLFKY